MTTCLKTIERAVCHQTNATSIKLVIFSKPVLCVFEELMHACGSKGPCKIVREIVRQVSRQIDRQVCR